MDRQNSLEVACRWVIVVGKRVRPDIRSSPLSKITVFWDAVHDCAAPEPQMTALRATRLPACESTEVRILESRGFGVCHCHGLSDGTRVVFALVSLETTFQAKSQCHHLDQDIQAASDGWKDIGITFSRDSQEVPI